MKAFLLLLLAFSAFSIDIYNDYDFLQSSAIKNARLNPLATDPNETYPNGIPWFNTTEKVFKYMVDGQVKVLGRDTDLSVTGDASTVTVESSTGNNADLPTATASTAGILTAADFSRIGEGNLTPDSFLTLLGTFTATQDFNVYNLLADAIPFSSSDGTRSFKRGQVVLIGTEYYVATTDGNYDTDAIAHSGEPPLSDLTAGAGWIHLISASKVYSFALRGSDGTDYDLIPEELLDAAVRAKLNASGGGDSFSVYEASGAFVNTGNIAATQEIALDFNNAKYGVSSIDLQSLNHDASNTPRVVQIDLRNIVVNGLYTIKLKKHLTVADTIRLNPASIIINYKSPLGELALNSVEGDMVLRIIPTAITSDASRTYSVYVDVLDQDNISAFPDADSFGETDSIPILHTVQNRKSHISEKLSVSDVRFMGRGVRDGDYGTFTDSNGDVWWVIFGQNGLNLKIPGIFATGLPGGDADLRNVTAESRARRVIISKDQRNRYEKTTILMSHDAGEVIVLHERDDLPVTLHDTGRPVSSVTGNFTANFGEIKLIDGDFQAIGAYRFDLNDIQRNNLFPDDGGGGRTATGTNLYLTGLDSTQGGVSIPRVTFSLAKEWFTDVDAGQEGRKISFSQLSGAVQDLVDKDTAAISQDVANLRQQIAGLGDGGGGKLLGVIDRDPGIVALDEPHMVLNQSSRSVGRWVFSENGIVSIGNKNLIDGVSQPIYSVQGRRNGTNYPVLIFFTNSPATIGHIYMPEAMMGRAAEYVPDSFSIQDIDDPTFIRPLVVDTAGNRGISMGLADGSSVRAYSVGFRVHDGHRGLIDFTRRYKIIASSTSASGNTPFEILNTYQDTTPALPGTLGDVYITADALPPTRINDICRHDGTVWQCAPVGSAQDARLDALETEEAFQIISSSLNSFAFQPEPNIYFNVKLNKSKLPQYITAHAAGINLSQFDLDTLEEGENLLLVRISDTNLGNLARNPSALNPFTIQFIGGASPGDASSGNSADAVAEYIIPRVAPQAQFPAIAVRGNLIVFGAQEIAAARFFSGSITTNNLTNYSLWIPLTETIKRLAVNGTFSVSLGRQGSNEAVLTFTKVAAGWTVAVNRGTFTSISGAFY